MLERALGELCTMQQVCTVYSFFQASHVQQAGTRSPDIRICIDCPCYALSCTLQICHRRPLPAYVVNSDSLLECAVSIVSARGRAKIPPSAYTSFVYVSIFFS